jgi:hypothetical protein
MRMGKPRSECLVLEALPHQFPHIAMDTVDKLLAALLIEVSQRFLMLHIQLLQHIVDKHSEQPLHMASIARPPPPNL